MPRTPAAPFHVGLTPARIVDVALQLTEERHLLAWSIRDLAGRLDVAPSVIYHHVGGKEVLCRRVVERVLAAMTNPPAELEWDVWFRDLLHALQPLVGRYPGVAKWLLMHGPAIPAVMPIIDRGVAALQRAGFGDEAGLAYAALFNNALLTISMTDDRLDHEDDGPRDHAAMMSEFAEHGAESPGVTVLSRTLVEPFAGDPVRAVALRTEYYRFVVDVTIEGLRGRVAR